MENASKALQIAAGVLLGVILMALVVFAFKQFGEWPEAQDKTLSGDQLAKFNKEFAVYEKSMMYGVDVISCLNKAQSYNDKYVLKSENSPDGYTSSGFFSGTGKYGDEFKIDIGVRINDEDGNIGYLKESVEIYKVFTTNSEHGRQGKENQILSANDWSTELNTYWFGKRTQSSSHENYIGFSVPNERRIYSHFENDTPITLADFAERPLDDGNCISSRGGNKEYPEGSGNMYYTLESSSHELELLMRFSDSNMKQIVYNPDKQQAHIWSKAIWRTAMYDFKQKKFTCDGIEYSPTTGQIECMYFSEI